MENKKRRKPQILIFLLDGFDEYGRKDKFAEVIFKL